VITLVDCWLPYGDTEIYVTINMENHLGTLTPGRKTREEPIVFEKEIQTALDAPMGGPSIHELVKPDCTVCIAVDGTMVTEIALEGLRIVISRLVDLIVPRDRITVLLGNGEREDSGGKILQAIREDKELSQVRLLNNTKNSSNHLELGETNRGTPIQVRREYMDASLKIAIGQTQVDPYTGFKGAFSAILPGITTHKTIERNRRYYFKENISPGKIENNPLKEDAIEVVENAGVDLALNFAVDYDGTLLSVRAGGFEESWGKSIYDLGNSYEIKSTGSADITVVSAGGICYDFNLYKALWALENASKVTKRNGTIILAAECSEGLGAEAFTKLSRVRELSEFERRYTYGAEVLKNLKKITRQNKVILESTLPTYLTDPLEIEAARTLNEGYEHAVNTRRGRKTLVIPYGCSTIISR
jgi:nickel-dependent lactate racemase